jgi:hypothetical protein
MLTTYEFFFVVQLLDQNLHYEYRNSNYRGKPSNFNPNYRGGSRGSGNNGRDYRDGNRAGNSSQSSRGVCWSCGKPGHRNYNCPDKKQADQKEARGATHNKNRDFDPESNKKTFAGLT